MVTIMCDTPDKLKISDLKAFQGDLKKRTSKDIEALSNSIQSDGLIMPFAVWKNGDENLLLDGHGRLAALTALALKDVSIVTQDFPVIYVMADTEEQARKSLLQITSSYGKIDKKGAIKFCEAIPEYHAPAINKYVYKKPVARKVNEKKNSMVIRLRVPEDKYAAALEIFKQVAYIEVL